MRRAERQSRFVGEIWAWYARHKRALPWRDLDVDDENERAYRILVSEVMLQQTQVSRVTVIFRRFLERFPTIKALAEASNKDVIIAWKGMGYNSRALRLRDAARTVGGELGGRFPREIEELLAINGIGAYTAAAVRNFAFGIPTPCVDTNIRRILHRTCIGPETAEGAWEADDRALLLLAEAVLAEAVSRYDDYRDSDPIHASPRATPAGDWHAALMDFGSLVCTKRSPKWDVCPLTAHGIMKTTRKNLPPSNSYQRTANSSPEPGRIIAGTFVPNRIIRGRIVEALREAESGLDEHKIGSTVCLDWDPSAHRAWLDGLLQGLARDKMIAADSPGRWALKE